MDKTLLHRVQLTQLEIAREIKRVCEENDIRFFLLGGTYLGAVRHQGFIPWDDDMDLGMLRGEYEKFCRIAPEKLGPDYCLQTWYTEPNYGLPFGKVMKRGTVYLESKKSRRLQENGIYVDIFPFDSVPQDLQHRQKLAKQLLRLYRLRLMKCGYKPWMEEDKVLWHKRLGYLFYQFQALFCGKQALARDYDALAEAQPDTDTVSEQSGMASPLYVRREWCEDLVNYTFEGEQFPAPRAYDEFLTIYYGDYMQLPPEDQRENRHQIVQVDFGDGEEPTL